MIPEHQAARPSMLPAIIAAAGCVGSIALMLTVGRHNPSVLLQVLFAGWVALPFVALILAAVFRKLTGARLTGLTFIVSLASVAAYAIAAFGPPLPKPAAVFLLVPLASWIVIAIVFAFGRHSGSPL